MDARETKVCWCCTRPAEDVERDTVRVWQCRACATFNPLPDAPAPPVPAPGDVLAWDDVASAMQQAAEWLHALAHGDPLIVVPENYRRVAEVLSGASLGRLAARPTPMTDHEIPDVLGRARAAFLAEKRRKGLAERTLEWHLVRAVEAHHGIAHPSPDAATTDHHPTRET
jgi:hypothetical protein